MTRTYQIERPSKASLQATAADLRRADDSATQDTANLANTQASRLAAGDRAHAAAVALPADWRTRDKTKTAEWPARDDLDTWRSIGASHAIKLSPFPEWARGAALNQEPYALAYCQGYLEIQTGYNMPDQHDQSPAQLEGYVQERHPMHVMQALLRKHSRTFGTLLKADDREQARFIAEVMQAVRAKPDLIETTRDSLMFGIAEAASMGLSLNPNLGECWLIPRTRRFKCDDGEWGSVYETNFQPGYKGLVKLAYRSELVDSIYVDVAYKGEVYKRTAGTKPDIVHEPAAEFRTGKLEDIIEAYAVVWLHGSTRPTFAAVTHRQLKKISDGAPRKGPWHTGHEEEMSKKSALIRVCKILPRSDELRGLHIVVERDLMREAEKAPPDTPELAAFREIIEEPDAVDVLPQIEPPHPDEAGG